MSHQRMTRRNSSTTSRRSSIAFPVGVVAYTWLRDQTLEEDCSKKYPPRQLFTPISSRINFMHPCLGGVSACYPCGVGKQSPAWNKLDSAPSRLAELSRFLCCLFTLFPQPTVLQIDGASLGRLLFCCSYAWVNVYRNSFSWEAAVFTRDSYGQAVKECPECSILRGQSNFGQPADPLCNPCELL